MRPVTKRELNQNTAAVLAQASTDSVVITERGRPRWRVSAIGGEQSSLERLEQAGLYTPPAQNPAPWPEKVDGPAYTEDELAALRDELRGEY